MHYIFRDRQEEGYRFVCVGKKKKNEQVDEIEARWRRGEESS